MSEQKAPIVVKRIKKVAGGHHGGAWKIAYADFVTAMMAFFLLMWLLGSTTKGDLEGIAEYFKTPLKVAMQGGSGSGDSSSVLKGGGQDLTRKSGQIKKGETEAEKKSYNLKAAQAELERIETERLKGLKQKLEAAIDSNPTLKQFKRQLLIDITSEGLRIQIVDEQNRPMFNLASADLQSYTKVILREIGHVLNDVPNRISLSGHTDATLYANGGRGYSNWELSTDRANASRRELIAGGMDEAKMLRVVGLASSVPFGTAAPNDPVNRRISIIVMNKRTEDAITKEASGVQVEDKEDVRTEIDKVSQRTPSEVAAAASAAAAAAAATTLH
ncbi:flagellar motor protein MotB [Betaproteobacteria bacterium SCN1]|jgi:chemotaxis protein MotB|nr:flagellar motor protein MotB [Betaproteobacteria bacterium SCN1]MBN8759785.1 flagellar motor protein MotB [Thiobacillus sp.]ODU89526.1 MAG: flagellar motor protein MotB [Thiobacillus sp. SCN 65-179]OJW37454.1 MAG: flagellar motor protein MotB [Thiobacillus sp. 65-69]